MSPRDRRPDDEAPDDGLPEEALPDEPPERPGRLRGAAWRLFPFRGRFLSPPTRYVYERLPPAPATFSSADLAVLCVEADRQLQDGTVCNPAEVIDLLVSRSLVVWTDGGFVKRSRPDRPRA